MRRTLVIGMFTALLGLTGCGDDDDGDAVEDDTPAAEDTTTSAAEATSAPCLLTQEDFVAIFGPGTLEGALDNEDGVGDDGPCIFTPADEDAKYNVRVNASAGDAAAFVESRDTLVANFGPVEEVTVGDQAFYLAAERFAQLTALSDGTIVTVSFNAFTASRPADARDLMVALAESLIGAVG